MKSESISDQKRLVRGEQWRFAQRFLRARDNAHNKRWRVLMVAGPEPSEEIRCIREFMPRADITAVDISSENLTRAQQAGADQTVECNILSLDRTGARRAPNPSLGADPFDVVFLDLTGPATLELHDAIAAHLAALTKGGVLISTISYGRDVREFYAEHWRKNKNHNFRLIERIEAVHLPDHIRDRMFFLLGTRFWNLRDVLQYRGAAMPMLSFLLTKHRSDEHPKFTAIEPSDYELAVVSEDLSNVYACPAERIGAIRRRAIAQKAVSTRETRVLSKQLDLLGDSLPTKRKAPRSVRRTKIKNELTLNADRSNREIARIVGVDHKTVGVYRSKLMQTGSV